MEKGGTEMGESWLWGWPEFSFGRINAEMPVRHLGRRGGGRWTCMVRSVCRSAKRSGGQDGAAFDLDTYHGKRGDK